MIKILPLFFLLFAHYSRVMGLPEGPLPDAVFRNNIKTVQFYKEGWEFSYPVYDMNNPKPLLFAFDDLDSNTKYYNYILVQCDADWMPSRISYPEYLDGFYQNSITNYQPSFGTQSPYMHYSLQLPNENVRFKLSGNYIILVYEDTEDNPILIKRFVVLNQKVDIVLYIKQPTLPVYQSAYQEIDFTILHSQYPIESPHQTLKVTVVKNNQWKFSINELKPLFIRNTELIYDYEDKNLFLGGNEYRSIDTKSLKYQEENVKSIEFRGNAYYVTLRPDKPRDRKGYLYHEDLNGQYLVQNQQGRTPATDAEYVHVLFNYPMEAPLVDGDIYVWGGFSDFNCYADYKMVYDIETHTYRADIVMKQGYYNYQYVYVPKNTGEADERYFEGSYYETENMYSIYVYHRPFGARYDQLIGFKAISSLKRTR